ncbi:serine/threonine-protein kinase [Micromonospora chersina]|uniref:serine/threonine-protein kinase n=1 Tax=Micromonospora chersina TaxID=47854 RepID=UPI003D8D05F2
MRANLLAIASIDAGDVLLAGETKCTLDQEPVARPARTACPWREVGEFDDGLRHGGGPDPAAELLCEVISSQRRQPGERIGDRYTLIRALGEGADGEVFLVRDTHLDKDVALKILTPKSDRAATWDEAQVLEQLQSEFLVPVFNADVLHPSDLRYIATAHIPGGDLGKRVKPVGTSVRQAVQWGINIAHGLVRMHTSGLVHRDVKPANVFVTDGGKALLGDLGKAHRLDETGQAPPTGTFQTVAPEVLTQSRCSIASDVYSLGATVCYLLTGRFPVNTGGSPEQVRDRIIAGSKRKIRDLGPHVPQSVGQILERCLTVDPASRPATALEVANRPGRRTASRPRLAAPGSPSACALHGGGT